MYFVQLRLAGRGITSREDPVEDERPSYFSRLYRQVTGHNLSDFINAKRMERAKELLAGTGLKIGDIALQVGFDSSSYFTVFFKKFQGVSPVEYRERAQNERG